MIRNRVGGGGSYSSQGQKRLEAWVGGVHSRYEVVRKAVSPDKYSKLREGLQDADWLSHPPVSIN